jgi:hypothetical protein
MSNVAIALLDTAAPSLIVAGQDSKPINTSAPSLDTEQQISVVEESSASATPILEGVDQALGSTKTIIPTQEALSDCFKLESSGKLISEHVVQLDLLKEKKEVCVKVDLKENIEIWDSWVESDTQHEEETLEEYWTESKESDLPPRRPHAALLPYTALLIAILCWIE